MIPVVLCGGSGTRLWPVSRHAFPKQFNQLLDESLLEKTLRRVRALGTPWVVAVAGTETLTRSVLGELALPLEQALFEPEGKNTAPAVALITRVLEARGQGDEVMGIFPADHLIEDEAGLRAVVSLAESCAHRGQVVTLGIRPTHPSTGYGYIEVGDEVFAESDGLVALVSRGFREKPDEATAQEFVERGTFLWNSGMFVFRVKDMARHLARLTPELWEGLSRLDEDLSNLAEVYRELSAESFDVAVMERLDEQVSIPCRIGWSDLGSWDEVARVRQGEGAAPGQFEEDAHGNFVLGHRDKVYGLVGVDDLIVVDTADATLVTRRGASQSVKGLVEQLKGAGHPSATEHTFEHRPWGEFEVLRDTEDFKSKVIRVYPHQQLSYQSHRYRAEHWVIVKGHPEVVLDGEVLTPLPGEAVHIPLGAKHRIRNPTDEMVEFVEVQLGSYFGEDDIVRYEDDYDRT